MVQRDRCVKNVNHGFHPTPYFNRRETEAQEQLWSQSRSQIPIWSFGAGHP